MSPTKPKPPEREVLSGAVERVTFHNPENGFCVLRVKARGQREPQTVVGHVPSVSPGEWIQATGQWINDRTHGPQFEAKHLRISEPESQEGIEKYLGSGLIRGIGPVYATKLVQAFGADVFEVIEHQPERLRNVPGIGPVRAQQITAAWGEQKSVREIMVFLHRHGVGTARSTRIYKTYGTDAIQIMSENPYRLVRDIRSISFKVADAIARKLGIEPTAPARVRAGVAFALDQARREGHCGLPQDDLCKLAQSLLEVPAKLAEEALARELEDGSVVADTVDGQDCIFLTHLYRAEEGIAKILAGLLRGRPPWPRINADKALAWVERRLDLKLAPSQCAAIREALARKVLVITGGPGVGKTTIVNAILRILGAKGAKLSLCAPTGRAAKRLSETSGREAKTIHRLLEFDPVRGGFRRDAANPLECDLLVVDETSMVDVPLMHALLKALPRKAALLAVGDADQLPSVGPGQVLADLIGSRSIPVVQLTEVFRQAAHSRIVVNAHRVNRGLVPDLGRPDGPSDFYYVKAEEPATAVKHIVELVAARIPQRFGLDGTRDVQVLCPMNLGQVGAKALNQDLQAAMNPSPPARAERLGRTFATGDKVMQVENDYDKEVYNGDIGYIIALDAALGELEVEFDGKKVGYGFGELDALVPAYATTIHKSQGSEYPAVVILLLSRHFVMLQRNLLYTAITRGKRLVVLVGQRRAIEQAVRTTAENGRCSKLRERVAALAA